MPREAWHREVSLLVDDFKDSRAADEDDNGFGENGQLSRAVRDKLWTVYRRSDEGTSSDFDPLNLVEPTEIGEVLDAGFTSSPATSSQNSAVGLRVSSTRSTGSGRL